MATATETLTTPAPPTTSKFRPWTMTADFYERMIEAGVFRKERVYLWKGQLVEKMVKERPHTVALTRLHHALLPVVMPGLWFLEQEASVRLLRRGDSMPEPDLKIVRGRMEEYPKIPTTATVPLVIEVADTSLADDRRDVLEVYAAEAIPVYWIANTVDRRIEVYTGPTGLKDIVGYTACTIYRPGQSVPVVLDGVEVGRIEVSQIFSESDPWLARTQD
jgi:Uma2 family endonuclease